MTENTMRGTMARTPDLDWSQVRETVLLLELATAQIEAAMKDSNTSVNVLTDSFTSMAGYMRMIGEAVQSLPDSGETAAIRQNLMGSTEQVSGMVNQAIIAFQFYDKLVQRLSHVSHSMGGLSDLVADKSRLFNPMEWVGLQDEIKSKYTTRDEVDMFNAVMSGVPIHDAIEQFVSAMNQGDDIELF